MAFVGNCCVIRWLLTFHSLALLDFTRCFDLLEITW